MFLRGSWPGLPLCTLCRMIQIYVSMIRRMHFQDYAYMGICGRLISKLLAIVAWRLGLSVLHLLATALLHLGLPLACLGLWHTCSVLVAASHARVHAPGSVGAVSGDNGPKKPGVVADNGTHKDAAISPVDDIPHVLGQALGIEVLASSLYGTIWREGGARQTLKVELDEQLRGGEKQIEEQRLAGKRGTEDEGSQKPPESMDG